MKLISKIADWFEEWQHSWTQKEIDRYLSKSLNITELEERQRNISKIYNDSFFIK